MLASHPLARSRARSLAFALAALVSAAGASGCQGFVRLSTTARSAQELAVISTAAQRAVRRIDLSAFRGKRVFIDVAPLDVTDRPYVIDALEQQLAEAGGVRAERASASDAVLEVRSGALATDERFFGLIVPLPPLPTALQKKIEEERGPVSDVRIGLLFQKQSSWAKLQAFAYHPKTGAFLGSFQGWGYARFGYIGDDVLVHGGVSEIVEEKTQ